MQVAVVGNLGKDPEIRKTKDGKDVCSFSLAETNIYDKSTSWRNVSVWGKNGEACAAHLKKGDTVTVFGDEFIKKWIDKHGVERDQHVITANRVVFPKRPVEDRAGETKSTFSTDDLPF